MIPGIIHYCWFGKNEIPVAFQSYVDGWKKLHPGYEIKFWNESNIPQNIVYVNTALQHQHYANASNYIRLWAIYHYGGIYLDTDFELLKSLDSFLNHQCFFGKECGNDDKVFVNNAIIGAVPGHWFIKQCLIELCYKFDGTEAANQSSPILTTELLSRFDIVETQADQKIEDIYLYNVSTFYANSLTNKNQPATNDRVVGIHHYAKTWPTKVDKLRPIKNLVLKYTPEFVTNRIRYGFKVANIIENKTVVNGPFKGLKFKILHAKGSSILPKLVGSYEECLHKSLYEFQLNNYENIYNFGAGEGYYALGLTKLLKPKGRIYAYDMDATNIQFLNENIDFNSGADQIEVIAEKVTAQTVIRISPNERSFILCDIEGHENSVFQYANIECLKNCDLIIELHEFIFPNVLESLASLFSGSHSLSVIEEDKFNIVKSRHLLATKNSYWQYQMVSENRPIPMKWLIAKSKIHIK